LVRTDGVAVATSCHADTPHNTVKALPAWAQGLNNKLRDGIHHAQPCCGLSASSYLPHMQTCHNRCSKGPGGGQAVRAQRYRAVARGDTDDQLRQSMSQASA